MKLEKLACCMARPMNAIRDLVSKVNEIIAAHNDHLENHPSGGGSSVTGGGVCMLNLKTETEDGNTIRVVGYDKTFDELIEAYNANNLLWCRLSLSFGGFGIGLECHLVSLDVAGGINFIPTVEEAFPGLTITITPEEFSVYIATE